MQRRQLLGSMAALSVSAALDAQQPSVAGAAMVPATYVTFDDWLTAAREASLRFLDTPAGRIT